RRPERRAVGGARHHRAGGAAKHAPRGRDGGVRGGLLRRHGLPPRRAVRGARWPPGNCLAHRGSGEDAVSGAGRARFPLRVDIGGQFTDIVFPDGDGGIHTKKVSSSVDDYARAIVEGLREVFRETRLSGPDVAEILHGTTVGSNAILELKGARTGLLTTKGFR